VSGFDPGVVNFGVAVIEIRGKGRSRIKPLFAGMFKKTIRNLHSITKKGDEGQSFRPQLNDYRAAVRRFFQKWKPKKFTVERFQARGIRGKQAELVTAMLTAAVIEAEALGIEFEAVTAAIWKNEYSRKCGKDSLNAVYLLAHWRGIPPHIFDAAMQACYKQFDYKYLRGRRVVRFLDDLARCYKKAKR
jgi:hypothetical protein